MPNAERRDSPDARGDDRPHVERQALEQLAGPGDLVDAFGSLRLDSFERRDFVRERQMRRDERHRLDCPAPVRYLHDTLGVEPPARGPGPPRTLDTLGGVDEDAVEVKE